MNAEIINKLHADVIESQSAADVMVAQLVEQKKKLSELSSRLNCTRETWEQRVVAIGNALKDAKTQVGKGWKRDFDKLGFEFSATYR